MDEKFDDWLKARNFEKDESIFSLVQEWSCHIEEVFVLLTRQRFLDLPDNVSLWECTAYWDGNSINAKGDDYRKVFDEAMGQMKTAMSAEADRIMSRLLKIEERMSQFESPAKPVEKGEKHDLR